jgi:K+ transporter
VNLLFFLSVLERVPRGHSKKTSQGGWLPVAIGALVLLLMTT